MLAYAFAEDSTLGDSGCTLAAFPIGYLTIPQEHATLLQVLGYWPIHSIHLVLLF